MINWGEDAESRSAADEFMEAQLSLIRRDAVDDRPDMWVEDRIELGLKCAARFIVLGKLDEAIKRVEAVVRLLEETMKITDEVLLPTSCRFLDGMEWRAEENWHTRDNDPDSPLERMIYIYTQMSGMSTCYCLYPSNYFDRLLAKDFDPLRAHPDFEAICDRIKALIITK